MGDTQERFNMGSDPLGMAIAREYGSVNPTGTFGAAGMSSTA